MQVIFYAYPTESGTSQSTQTAVTVLDLTGSSLPSSSPIPDLQRIPATVPIGSGGPPVTSGNIQPATTAIVSGGPPVTSGNIQPATTAIGSDGPPVTSGNIQPATTAIGSGGPPVTNGNMQSALLGIGPILGIAISSAVLMVVLTIVVVFLCFRRNKHSAPKSLHHFTGTGKLCLNIDVRNLK